MKKRRTFLPTVPTDIISLYIQVFILLQQKRYKESERMIEDALKISAEAPEAILSLTHHHCQQLTQHKIASRVSELKQRFPNNTYYKLAEAEINFVNTVACKAKPELRDMLAIKEEIFDILASAKTPDEYAKLALFAITISLWDVGIGLFAWTLRALEVPLLVYPLNDNEELLKWTTEILQMNFGARDPDTLPTATIAKAAYILYLAEERKIPEASLALTLLQLHSSKVRSAYKERRLPEFIATHALGIVPGRGSVPPITWQRN